jgi:hypothetical protein
MAVLLDSSLLGSYGRSLYEYYAILRRAVFPSSSGSSAPRRIPMQKGSVYYVGIIDQGEGYQGWQ